MYRLHMSLYMSMNAFKDYCHEFLIFHEHVVSLLYSRASNKSVDPHLSTYVIEVKTKSCLTFDVIYILLETNID